MKHLSCISLFCFALFSMAQEQSSLLQMYTVEEMLIQQVKQPRPVVVFVHTNWCKYCKMMDKNTFTDSRVIQLLNTSFYFVKFDAESKEEVVVNGKSLQYKLSGYRSGIHEFAERIAKKNNTVAFPTTVVLNKSLHIDLQVNSFLSADSLNSLLLRYLQETTKTSD
ncbi:thioredoxin fold domain-containing protein [Tenacibaculum sp. SG-28]|uniref:thioredoxin family protein n=1 Tax=Tenacibaculum sp. SG-28 TaxID=754426 RepID=UPI000CF46F84|nr:thioredoxin fold domain-containing protein [Tenacibaculum sp. SG-28]